MNEIVAALSVRGMIWETKGSALRECVHAVNHGGGLDLCFFLDETLQIETVSTTVCSFFSSLQILIRPHVSFFPPSAL